MVPVFTLKTTSLSDINTPKSKAKAKSKSDLPLPPTPSPAESLNTEYDHALDEGGIYTRHPPPRPTPPLTTSEL